MDVLIRPIEERDLESVRSLLTQLSPYTPSLQQMKDALETIHKTDSYACVAVSRDGDICGTGFVYFIQKIRGGIAGQIEDIAVKEQLHGCGIGSLIVNHLAQKCVDRGCYSASLCCKEHNIVFYSRQGFVGSGAAMTKNLLGSNFT